MRRRDALRALRVLFPRKRRWQPTPRWRGVMLENLSRAPRLRSVEETWRIKQAVRDWLAAPPEQRPTQQDLARSLGVSKQYINRLAHRLPPREDASEPPAPGVIPAHIAAREAFLRPAAQSPGQAARSCDAPSPQRAGIPISRIWGPGREQTDNLLREWAGVTNRNRGNSWF